MKLKELVRDLNVSEMHADPETEISGVSADSRKTKPGDMFVAVCGYESDGHAYIGSAKERGALCVLCEKKPETDIPYILTDNTRRGLSVASANLLGRPAESMKLLAVTGTNGKTTTTTLLKTVIEKATGEKCGLIGTNRNMIGEEELPAARTTPESNELQELFRRMVDEGCKYAVMEVSSHALYLDRVSGVTFEGAVFTNLTQDHLDFHKTMDAYAEAKAILFRQTRRGAVNMDDKYAPVMERAASCPMLTYSAENNDADIVAKDIRLSAGGVRFAVVSDEGLDTVKLAIPGMFSVYNALSVLAGAKLLGIPITRTAELLAECSGVKGRAEIVPTGRDFTVVIDYAHTPDALENIITTLRDCSGGRIVTLFGCGGDRDRSKRPLMGAVASGLSDFVIVTSDNPRTESPEEIIAEILPGVKETKCPYKVIVNRTDAIEWAIRNARENDVILLAGKGHETYQEINKVKHHMDEREIVRDVLASL